MSLVRAVNVVAKQGTRSFHTTTVARAGKEYKLPLAVPNSPKKATNGISELFYRLFMRRSTTYVSLIMIGAIVGDDLYQNAVEDYWEKQNKGKLFKDIVGKFPEVPPNCE